jgi:hypothetical protein
MPLINFKASSCLDENGNSLSVQSYSKFSFGAARHCPSCLPSPASPCKRLNQLQPRPSVSFYQSLASYSPTNDTWARLTP